LVHSPFLNNRLNAILSSDLSYAKQFPSCFGAVAYKWYLRASRYFTLTLRFYILSAVFTYWQYL